MINPTQALRDFTATLPRACPHCGLWMAAQPKETPQAKEIVAYWECWNSQCGKGYSEGKLYIKEEPRRA